MRSEIERVLADLVVKTKPNVKAIAENCLTKCPNMLQSQVVKSVQCTLEEALQASYSSSNKGLKSTIFRAVEQDLSEVV